MTKTIEVIVAPDGQTCVETKGFAGASCQEVSRFIEQALGRRTCEQHTAEFFQQAANQHVIQENSP